jgi:hypothetical protein
MAIAAQLNAMMRNREPGVIERRTQPRGRRMTGLARGREPRSHMVRIGGSAVIRLVTRIAVRGRAGELTVDVATRAGHGGVGARQGKAGGVVIESGRRPRRGVVADLTLLRESRRLVIGIIRLVVIAEMARHAGCVRNLEIPAHVATGAGKLHMRAGQRKSCLVMVEASRRPGGRAVADRAIRGETGGGMIRIGGLLVVGKVAGGAIVRRPGKLSIHMTLHTGNVHVGARSAGRL